MKTASLFSSLRIFIASVLIGLGLLEIGIYSANAHPTFREAVDALSYPRSSQRFFEKGQAQLETEIRYLQQNTLASSPTFRINRDLLLQRQLLQRQQERWLKERMRQTS
jgi:hypothetical protein